MEALFFIFIFFLLPVICGIIMIVSLLIKNKRIKHILRMIGLLIVGIPASCFIFIFLCSLSEIVFVIYIITINVLGVGGKIIYKIYLHATKKNVNKNINALLNVCLCVTILSDLFPILLLLSFLFVRLS